jgi:hypothetical protein
MTSQGTYRASSLLIIVIFLLFARVVQLPIDTRFARNRFAGVLVEGLIILFVVNVGLPLDQISHCAAHLVMEGRWLGNGEEGERRQLSTLEEAGQAAVEVVVKWRPLPTMVVVMLLTAINFAILTSASGLEVVADQGCCT